MECDLNPQAAGIHTCHSECERVECVTRREVERHKDLAAELRMLREGTERYGAQRFEEGRKAGLEEAAECAVYKRRAIQACERIGCEYTSQGINQKYTPEGISNRVTGHFAYDGRDGRDGRLNGLGELSETMRNRIGPAFWKVTKEIVRYQHALEEIARLDQGQSAWLARRALNWEEK